VLLLFRKNIKSLFLQLFFFNEVIPHFSNSNAFVQKKLFLIDIRKEKLRFKIAKIILIFVDFHFTVSPWSQFFFFNVHVILNTN